MILYIVTLVTLLRTWSIMPANIHGISLMLRSLTGTSSALTVPWANYPTGVFLLLSVALHTHLSLSTWALSLSPLSCTIVISTWSPLWITICQWRGLHLCTLKMLHWLPPATFWRWCQPSLKHRLNSGCPMLGESTNPKLLTQCSRNRGFAFFRVLPTLLNKTVVLNDSCAL